MDDSKTKIIAFDWYCKKCKHSQKSGTDEPCNECLTEPVNWDSRKPVEFEEKK